MVALSKLQRDPIPELKGHWSDELRELLDACLTRNQFTRPNASELLQYAIFDTACDAPTFAARMWP